MEGKKEILVKLANPAQRALANAGITLLNQPSKFREQEIAALHGIGSDALSKLRQAIVEKGWTFIS
ncbi:MAG: hypothetical protein ABIO46_05970 [Chitinophagales bacterium]